MEQEKILKNTGYLSVPKILSFILGTVRAKINAIYLGTEGLGVISQIQDSFNKMSALSLFSTDIATIKLISQHKTESDKVLSIIKTSLFISVPVLMVVYISGIIFSNLLAKYFLGTEKYNSIFFIVMFFFPFLVLKSFPSSILQGYLKIKYMASIEMVVSITSFIIYIPMVISFKLTGAIINYTFIITFTFFVFLYFAEFKTLKSLGLSFKSVIKANYNKKFTKEILSILGIGTFLEIVDLSGDMLSRLIIVHNLSIEKIGIYSPIFAWGSLFYGFIMPAASTYLFPRFSELKTNYDIANVINDGMRVITFLIVPFVFIAITFRKFAIPIFYSNSFIEAERYLPLHFIGLIIFIWVLVFSLVFTPTGRIAKYIPFVLGHNILSIIIMFLLTPQIGLWALCLKNFITPLLTFIALYIFFSFEVKFSLNAKNKFLFLYSIAGGLVLYLLPEIYYINNISSFVLIILMYFILTSEEKNAITQLFKKYFKIIGNRFKR